MQTNEQQKTANLHLKSKSEESASAAAFMAAGAANTLGTSEKSSHFEQCIDKTKVAQSTPSFTSKHTIPTPAIGRIKESRTDITDIRNALHDAKAKLTFSSFVAERDDISKNIKKGMCNFRNI